MENVITYSVISSLLVGVLAFFLKKWINSQDEKHRQTSKEVHEIKTNYLARFESVHTKLEANKDFFNGKIDEVKTQIHTANVNILNRLNDSSKELIASIVENLRQK